MRTRTLVVASAALLLLTGCATPTAAGRAPSASPTPTAACPEQPGVELPPECAGYDPEHSMAQNDAYRQRGELDPAVEEAARDIAEAAADDLEALRTSVIYDVEPFDFDGGVLDTTASDASSTEILTWFHRALHDA